MKQALGASAPPKADNPAHSASPKLLRAIYFCDKKNLLRAGTPISFPPPPASQFPVHCLFVSNSPFPSSPFPSPIRSPISPPPPFRLAENPPQIHSAHPLSINPQCLRRGAPPPPPLQRSRSHRSRRSPPSSASSTSSSARPRPPRTPSARSPTSPRLPLLLLLRRRRPRRSPQRSRRRSPRRMRRSVSGFLPEW